MVLPQESSEVRYCGIHIFMATTSLFETRGRGRRNSLKMIVAFGSSERHEKGGGGGMGSWEGGMGRE